VATTITAAAEKRISFVEFDLAGCAGRGNGDVTSAPVQKARRRARGGLWRRELLGRSGRHFTRRSNAGLIFARQNNARRHFARRNFARAKVSGWKPVGRDLAGSGA